jgi:hypothetical protein
MVRIEPVCLLKADNSWKICLVFENVQSLRSSFS